LLGISLIYFQKEHFYSKIGLLATKANVKLSFYKMELVGEIAGGQTLPNPQTVSKHKYNVVEALAI
jgi:hypothetical protein